MTLEQKEDFQKRRNKVMRRHIANDPKLRKARRQRRRSVALSVLGSLVAVAGFMVVLKSFVLAVHGPRDYAQMVAPMVESNLAGGIVGKAFSADPISTEIAAFLRPMLPQQTNLAANAPVQNDPVVIMPDPDTAEPEI